MMLERKDCYYQMPPLKKTNMQEVEISYKQVLYKEAVVTGV